MSKWIPPHLVHLIVQYSQSDRPAMTRRTASRALHCGQLESTVAEGDRVGPDSGMGCCSLQVVQGINCGVSGQDGRAERRVGREQEG